MYVNPWRIVVLVLVTNSLMLITIAVTLGYVPPPSLLYAVVSTALFGVLVWGVQREAKRAELRRRKELSQVRRPQR